MTIRYQQVSTPGLGGIGGIGSGGSSISAGLRSIGTGLTNLGTRREERMEKDKAKADAAALETFKQSLLGAETEDDVAALLAQASAGGTPVVGGADAAAARQRSILDQQGIFLDQEGKRASNAGLAETNRGVRIGNDGEQLKLDVANNAVDFDKRFGGRINEANIAGRRGDTETMDNILDEITREASPLYGADIVNDMVDDAFGRLKLGDETRTGIKQNDLDLRQGEESLRGTRVGTDIQIDANRDRGRAADLTYEQGRNALDQVLNAQAEDKTVRDQFAAYTLGATSQEDVLYNIRQDLNLKDVEKTRVLSAVNQAFAADPNLLNTYNPLDPSARPDNIFSSEDQALARSGGAGTVERAVRQPDGSYRREQVTSNNRQNAGVVAAGIQRSADAFVKGNDSQSIYNEAFNFEQQEGDLPNVTQYIRDKYPELEITDRQGGKLLKIAQEENLTESEMLAIADRAIKRRGTNLINWLPGGDHRDDTVFSPNRFREIAREYKNQNPARLAEQSQLISQYTAQSQALVQRLTQAKQERQRAIQAGDSSKKSLLDIQITDMNDELAGIQSVMDSMVQEDQK